MTPVMSRPNAVIFDWDNTLVDTWPAIHDALNHTLTAMGHAPWSFEQTKERAKKSLRESFPDLFGENWLKAKDIFYTRFEQSHIEQLAPLPHAESLLQHLSHANIPLFIVSNKTSQYLQEEINHLNWQSYFKESVGAGDAIKDKPDPAPVHLALKKSNISIDYNVWFVGDTDVDLLCAKNTSCHSILIRNAPPRENEFQEAPPTWYFKNCQDFIDAFVNCAVA